MTLEVAAPPQVIPTVPVGLSKPCKLYHPKEVRWKEAASTKALVDDLWREWTDRLLAYLLRCPQAFPKIEECQKHDEAHQGMRDLFGAFRWSTIRGHVQCFVRKVKNHPELRPWTSEKLSRNLNNMESMKVHPERPVAFMESLDFIGQAVGFPTPDLMGKAKRIRRSLTITLARENRRAAAPEVDDIEALVRSIERSDSGAVAYNRSCFASKRG